MSHAQAEADNPAGAGKQKRERLAMVIMIAGFVVALVLNGAFTVWTVSESQHRWCSTITTLDKADRKAPKPTSQFGRNLVADFHRLRSEFGCSL